MIKLILINILLLGLLATPVLAANITKYTFNDIVISNQVVEIEASVKGTRKSGYSTCNYYSDNYIQYLGLYAKAVFAGSTAQQVRDYCIAHYSERVL